MIEIQKKGFYNRHSLISHDDANIANADNARVFSEIIRGKAQSPSFDYLLNIHKHRISDYKSFGMYTGSGLALELEDAKKLEEILDDQTIILPAPRRRIRANFTDVLKTRKSTRNFKKSTVKQKDFSTMLNYSFGIADHGQVFSEKKINYRYYPSGGALYPIRIILYVNRVEGIDPGFYEYQPYSHSIRKVNINAPDQINQDNFFPAGGFEAENSSFTTFFVYDLARNYLKYGELSLFNTCVELGAMIQNQYLVSNAMLYDLCAIAGIDKPLIEKYIGSDGIIEHVLAATICGKEEKNE